MKINLTKKQIIYLGEQAIYQRNRIDSNLSAATYGLKPVRPDMLISDAAKLMNYYSVIISGDFRKAKRLQDDMDTAVHEEIPNKIYNLIDNNVS